MGDIAIDDFLLEPGSCLSSEYIKVQYRAFHKTLSILDSFLIIAIGLETILVIELTIQKNIPFQMSLKVRLN